MKARFHDESEREAGVGLETGVGLEASGTDEMRYRRTEDFLKDACTMVEESEDFVRRAGKLALLRRNWLLGKRVSEERPQAADRAECGEEGLGELSKKLAAPYLTGLDEQALRRYAQFYRSFPEVFSAAWRQSQPLLSWSHYCVLLQVRDYHARAWYEREATEQGWSVRTLKRNVEARHFERMLESRHPEELRREAQQAAEASRDGGLEGADGPEASEFPGLSLGVDAAGSESCLEEGVLAGLRKDLGEGLREAGEGL